MAASIESLRSRLDELDDRLLELLAERNRVVSEVAESKLENALPVFVPEREGDKTRSFRARAERFGVDADWAEDFLRMVMSSSRARQSLDRFPSSTAEPKTVLLVGGYGEMGTLYGRVLAASGHRVAKLGREDWPRAGALASGVDLAIVTVDIGETLPVIERLAPFLGDETVLADFTSTKGPPLEAMLAHHPGPVVGLHPMHGPDVENLSRQLMLVCPGRGRERYGWLLRQCELWGMRLKEVDPAGHDRAMHVVQGLRHFVALLHGSFLRAARLRPEEILDFSSPVYRAELMMTGRIFAQDAELYAEIVLADEERRELIRRFFDHHRELIALAEEGDKAGFEREFRAIGDFFGDFAAQALEESSYLIHRLADRFA